MTERRHLGAMLVLALGAAGCATSPTSTLDVFAQRSANNSFELFDRGVDPPGTLVLAVFHDRQTSQISCGAHALASIIKYWRGPDAPSGNDIFAASPPADLRIGYSMAELITLARQNGLVASGVRLGQADVIRELERGRPVLVPVRVPSIFIQPWALPGANVPVLGIPASVVTSRVAWLSERGDMAMVGHYLVIVGYEDETFVTVDPVMGYRTIRFDRLARYRRAYNNAAIVFSGPPRAADDAAASSPAAPGAVGGF